MKKRILALSLALALLALMVPTAVFAATLTKTEILDMDFDTGALENKVEGGTISWNHVKWTAMAFQPEAIRNNTALCVTNNSAAAGGINGRAATAEVTLSENDVIWYEFSFLQQNQPVGVQIQNGLSGISLKNDVIQLGHLATLYPTTKLTKPTFGLNQWYHVVFAIDQLDRVADNNGQAPKMYLWANGELVDNGKGYTALQDSRSVSRGIGSQTIQFMVMANTADTTNSGVVYVDNVKVYTTNQAVKNDEGAMPYYDPYESYGSASISANNYYQKGSTIYVPETATLSDVLDDISAEGTVSCYNNGVLTGDYTEAAVGKLLYVQTEGAVMPRSYSIASNKIKDYYYDMNFDASSLTNAVTGYTFGYCGATSTATESFADDPVRGNKALKMDFSAAGKMYYKGSGAVDIDLRDRAMWYELSFMAEDSIPSFEIRSQARAFRVFDDGRISVGGIHGVAAIPGELLLNPDDPTQPFKFETGKWYHLVVAIDNIDLLSETASKIYAWVNGQQLFAIPNTEKTHSSVSSTGIQSQRTSTDAINFWAQSSAAGTLYLDNYKVYSTIASVADYDYDPMSIYSGAAEPNENSLTVNNVIYAPADTTPAEVQSGFSTGETVLKGDTIYALTVDKAYANPYSLKNVENGYQFVTGTKALRRANGMVVDAASLAKGDKVKFTGVLTNFGGEEKSGVLVLAAYNDGKLADCVMTNVTSGSAVETSYLTISDTTDLTIRAFLWNDLSGITPAMSAVY